MAEFNALIILGDGMQGIYCDEKNVTTNREGIKVQPILVAPSIELKAKYRLTDEDLNILTEEGRRAMWVEYPIDEIDWLRKSKTGAVLFIWCAFDSSETPIMKKLEGLLEKIKENDRERMMLRATIFSRQSEIEYVTSNQTELFRKYKEMQEVIGKKETSMEAENE